MKGSLKWPSTLTLVRHDISTFNAMKSVKEKDPLYQEFKSEYEKDPRSRKTQKLAFQIAERYTLKHGSHNTPLDEQSFRGVTVGKKLVGLIPTPDVIFVSPYLRTLQTLNRLLEGWPQLTSVKTVDEERIREQDMGLLFVYNDRRLLFALHPEQKDLYDREGPYWYRYPQGESIPDVRSRIHSWLGTLTRDFRGQNVLAVTHHLTILALRANLERLSAEEFLDLDTNEKPANCSVTIYEANLNQGTQGKLILKNYNLILY